jgi:hypothetical protein
MGRWQWHSPKIRIKRQLEMLKVQQEIADYIKKRDRENSDEKKTDGNLRSS